MKYNELTVSSYKNAKRVGRGISAGQGKTAGRGTKGQKARKSGGVRLGFEGGQMPIFQRQPKLRGFRSFRAPTIAIYTSALDKLKGSSVDNFSLAEAGLLPHPYVKAKLILNGEVTKKFTVGLQAASESAIAAIQKAGGTFTKTELPKRSPKSND